MAAKTVEPKEPLLAWHGDAELRKSTVATMAAHRKADTLVKGIYWEGGKGCAVGCLIHGSDHSLYEPRFGIPQALARLEDTIFESLPNGDAKMWPERFLKAAKPGADLSLVQWQFLEFVVDEALSRKEAASVREACKPALEVVRSRARGKPVSESAESAAESAARSAESAARSAARSAESAAWSAAKSAESAARSAGSAGSAAESAAAQAAALAALAARSAAWSARSAARSAGSAGSAARSAAWKRYADKLIDLMANAPVPQMQEAA